MKLWKKRDTDSCPRCSASDEDRVHIIQCSHPEASTLWITALAQLEQFLISLSTPPTVARNICHCFQSWHDHTTPVDNNIPAHFDQAFRAQDALGWESFLFGFWSNHWESIQQAHLILLNSKVSLKRWSTSIIIKLWDVAWDLWDHRNTYIHHQEQGLVVQ
jgi:hypothetical protein